MLLTCTILSLGVKTIQIYVFMKDIKNLILHTFFSGIIFIIQEIQ